MIKSYRKRALIRAVQAETCAAAILDLLRARNELPDKALIGCLTIAVKIVLRPPNKRPVTRNALPVTRAVWLEICGNAFDGVVKEETFE